jgi:hypothetical protein
MALAISSIVRRNLGYTLGLTKPAKKYKLTAISLGNAVIRRMFWSLRIGELAHDNPRADAESNERCN